VTGAGLPARPVAAQIVDRDAQPLRQPGHRGGRGRRNIVGHKPSHGSVHS
jgi:hypothetical protein